MWPNSFWISNICNPTKSSMSHHIPFNSVQTACLATWVGLPLEGMTWWATFQIFKVPMKMRLFWLSLVLSLAKRLHPVVEEVARWCFQPFFSICMLGFLWFSSLFSLQLVFGCVITPFLRFCFPSFPVWIAGIFVFFHHGKYKCRLIPHGQGRSGCRPIFPRPQPPQSTTIYR